MRDDKAATDLAGNEVLDRGLPCRILAVARLRGRADGLCAGGGSKSEGK